VAITASELRANVYQLLDRVLATGVPLEVARGSARLRIVPVDERSVLDRLPRRPEAITGDPEDLVHLDWSAEWNP